MSNTPSSIHAALDALRRGDVTEALRLSGSLIDNGRGQIVLAPSAEVAREAEDFIRSRLVTPKTPTRMSPWIQYHCEVYPSLAEAIVAIQDSVGEQTVYLCGGINGLSDAACKDWRYAARELLIPGFVPSRFKVRDPMARDYRGREDECVDEIVEGDKYDIHVSDIILVNASRPSWGTAMEIMFAWFLHKRIVAFMEEA